MIPPTSAAAMTPPEKAQVIYEQARSDMAGRLWRAALGVDDAKAASGDGLKTGSSSLNLLIALLDEHHATPMQGQAAVPPKAAPPPAPQALDPDQGRGSHHGLGREAASSSPDDGEGGEGDSRNPSAQIYGPNAAYAGLLGAASRRTGLPASALATIVHAEAAKDKDGRWMPYSRNPRSSAAGLGQFLSGTWIGEAGRKGTWLNSFAAQNGWLSAQGKVKSEHRSALLSLRYNAEAAIEATADYAAANLAALRKAGVTIADGAQGIAKAAYLGHHLGFGDAVRFLKGGLDPDRARILLSAQVGASASSQRIAASGNAAAAHRSWLNDYIKTNIQVGKFSA